MNQLISHFNCPQRAIVCYTVKHKTRDNKQNNTSRKYKIEKRNKNSL